MIKALECAIDKVKELSADRQQLAAELLEQFTADAVYPLSDIERLAVQEGLAELNRGERASADEVRAVLDKYRT
jgi:predicted transcriptional regulator